MSTIVQVRGVPDDVHDTLKRQAETAGMSLNRFLLAEFEAITRRSRNAAIFDRARTRGGRRLGREQIVEELRDLREHGE